MSASLTHAPHRPAIPEDTNAKLRKLIERCWHPNPSLRPAFSEIVECLDEVILDIAIADDYGKKLWNDCFKKKESVRWGEFKAAFGELLEWSKKHFKTDLPPLPDAATPEQLREASSKQLEDYASRSQPNYVQVAEEFHRRQAEGLPLEGPRDVYGDPKNEELNFKCLKAVLADDDQPRTVTEIGADDSLVSMERFGKVLSWFGPLVDLHYGVIIMDKIRIMLSKKWFHGNITTKDAEICLLSKGPGAYLVRFSTSSAGTYTLSKVSRDGSINHQRIVYQQVRELTRSLSLSVMCVCVCVSLFSMESEYLLIKIVSLFLTPPTAAERPNWLPDQPEAVPHPRCAHQRRGEGARPRRRLSRIEILDPIRRSASERLHAKLVTEHNTPCLAHKIVFEKKQHAYCALIMYLLPIPPIRALRT